VSNKTFVLNLVTVYLPNIVNHALVFYHSIYLRHVCGIVSNEFKLFTVPW